MTQFDKICEAFVTLRLVNSRDAGPASPSPEKAPSLTVAPPRRGFYSLPHPENFLLPRPVRSKKRLTV